MAATLRRAARNNIDPWARLLDVAALEGAKATRDLANWERVVDVESATLSGLLVDLVEGAHTVSIRTHHGQPLVGQIRAVGTDAFALVQNSELIIVSMDALATVESLHDSVDAASEREPTAFSLLSCLQRAAQSRADVVLSLVGSGQTISGRLRSCGTDVCTLAAGAHSRRRTHVCVRAISMVRILP
jgi:hypothetical protein